MRVLKGFSRDVNTLLSVGMQAIAEAVVLGESDRPSSQAIVRSLVADSGGRAGSCRKLAKIERNDYSPQFPLRLMNKDVQLILKTAARENLPIPVTEAAFRVNADELVPGDREDFSVVLRRTEEVAGVAVTHSSR